MPAPQPASAMAHHEMPQGMPQAMPGMHHGMSQGMPHEMPGAHPSSPQGQELGTGEEMAQHGGHGAPSSAPGHPSSVVGEGKVIAVVPERGQIVVDHQAIPGVMGAMTMGYRVEPPALLTGVKAGETIRFTMDPQQQVIIRMETLHE
jgi:Cu/Ag efflux protein CusF